MTATGRAAGPGPDGGEPEVALVTGAARGIGAAVVRRFVARGCQVHAVDACLGGDGGTAYALATRSDLDALVAEAPGQVHPHVADVRDPAALAAVVASVRERHGRLDAVVAGAAVIEGGDALWDTDPAVLERLWSTDVAGVWNTAQATVPVLLEAGGPASFVAITSAAGERGLWHLSAYCAVKHAVVGLVRGLAADLRGTDVWVAGVAPGSTDTDMLTATARLYGLPDVTELLSSSSIGRVLEPDEVARVVELAAFAGPVVHGSILAADGGFGH
ncbi:MAG: family oxidoreductase [Marmoricola sp.]|nr:family oxidoreductase [Marmoricola sp.]